MASRESGLDYDQLVSGRTIYSYVEGNPVSYIDPTGEFLQFAIPAAVGLYGAGLLTGVIQPPAIPGKTKSDLFSDLGPHQSSNSSSSSSSSSASSTSSEGKVCPPNSGDPCDEIRRQIRDLQAKLATKETQLANDPNDLYNRAYSLNLGGDLAGKGTYLGHLRQIEGLRIGLARKVAEAIAMGCL